MSKKPYETPLVVYVDLTCLSGICVVSNRNYPGSESEDWDREDLYDDIWED